ncbi:MAG: NADH-quinone oxidoreductase subunit L [Nitrososphaerota archaeon]|nr:NADH-quinone oxidoreductase subunit L [Candidatus Calditenuaceae archaeon]MDW8072927.1 NADH-quinone oxidoreductase subunit L [Nitrososphaerota archaeon]
MLEAWLIWLLPMAASFLIPGVIKVSRRVGEVFSVAVVATAAFLTAQFLPWVSGGQSLRVEFVWINLPGGGAVRLGVLLDPLSVIMALIATGIGALILLYSIGYMSHEKDVGRYYFFMTLFIGGMVLLVTSSNLLGLYIGWEIVGICSYALIGYYVHRREAREAAIKAFVTTRVGDVLLLASILLTFAAFNTLELTELRHIIEDRASTVALDMGLLMLVMLLAFGGAVGKSAQFPLHVWLPDAMEGPTPVSALIHAATMVKAGVYLIARYSLTLVPFERFTPAQLADWFTTISLIGGFTALFAASMGLVSNDIKRVIAYSTISQLALMFTALGVGTALGWFGGVFHVVSHSVFKALLFLAAGAVIHYLGTNNIDEMGGLRRFMPITFATSLVGVLALSGIPPFNGFFSKDVVLGALLESEAWLPLILVSTASILTVVYSFRWLSKVFLGEPRHHLGGHGHAEPPKTMIVPLIVLAALTLTGLPPFEESLHHFIGIHEELKIPTATYALSAIILAIGLTLSYLFYIRRVWKPEVLRQNPLLNSIHVLLVNRYYIDAAYKLVFVDGFTKLSSLIRRNLEERVIDGVNYAAARGFQRVVEAIRYIQTGSSNLNISGVAVGLIILLFFLLARLAGLL